MPAHWTFRLIAGTALVFGLFAAKTSLPHATVSITHVRPAYAAAFTG